MKTMQEIDAIYKSEMSQARLEGRQEQGYLLVLRQLARRVGNVSIAYGASGAIELQERVKSLPLEKVETLGEDLLDFAQLDDLLAWLERNK